MSTEVGPDEIEVLPDCRTSFEPVIVPKRNRRPDGMDQIVLSLYAQRLPTREISADFEDLLGPGVQDTISRIT
ncbi:hypothetical protein AHIS1636_40340 [Arthrobacter mangrovi]|uniref:Mutator family transposase n=1 Tax=Arthrobacter mangrovi TaxID=2966350 RepID=A0ABQ5N045_9MICC|nr:hypothetical protein AHIS1636_40340 [Arthrobacter mangrovi]